MRVGTDSGEESGLALVKLLESLDNLFLEVPKVSTR
jgi:hypothetical protein